MLTRWRRQKHTVFDTMQRWLDLSAHEIKEAVDMSDHGRYSRHHSVIANRDLQVPQGSLYTLQSRIYKVLLQTAPVASAAHGGVPGRSIKTHAAVHLPEARCVLAMDVQRAYESCEAKVVGRVFRRALRPLFRQHLMDEALRRNVASFLTLVTTVDNHLPLGGPCSAALFNLAAQPFDKAMERLVLHRLGQEGRYSRYLDDVVVSSPSSLPGYLPAMIGRLMRVHDLGGANRKKTQLMDKLSGDELVVTGLTHDGRGLALTAERLRGFEEALRKASGGHGSPPNPQQGRGLMSFLKSIYGRRLPRHIESLGESLGEAFKNDSEGR